MAIEAGILERRLDVKGLVDRQFIPADIIPARIDIPQSPLIRRTRPS